ncbi:hypothetical protein GcM3_198011 [Golovinomyces cichoracearum]|uniref:Eukaryotic translation initiation factor 3 subunit G N-terminal domain-containing protein n=1 Tax=Golovinomyces cichoracearum TaxID=62708 RepID=A0A420HEZ4_9PEZI|nr:hypothetical protein GcM3_198011 [Golovinomyces cichoracearum]
MDTRQGRKTARARANLTPCPIQTTTAPIAEEPIVVSPLVLEAPVTRKETGNLDASEPKRKRKRKNEEPPVPCLICNRNHWKRHCPQKPKKGNANEAETPREKSVRDNKEPQHETC